MRAAILTAYNEPLVIEEVTTPAIGPHDVLVHIDASGVCHSDLSFAKGNVPAAAAGHPRPRGRRHGARGRLRRVAGQGRRPRSSPRSPPRAATASSASATSRSCARRWARTCSSPQGHARRRHRGHRRERARHLRRRDDRRRVDAGEGRDRPPVRSARAHRLRHHHRRRRRAEHRAGASRVPRSPSSGAVASASRSSRARASPARRASSPSTRWR